MANFKTKKIMKQRRRSRSSNQYLNKNLAINFRVREEKGEVEKYFAEMKIKSIVPRTHKISKSLSN